MKVFNVMTGRDEQRTDGETGAYIRRLTDINMALWARVRELEAKHAEPVRFTFPVGDYDVLVLPRSDVA